MKRALLVPVVLLSIAGPAAANEFAGALMSLAEGELRSWAADPTLIEAIRAQNTAHEGLSQADIDTLDQTWRAEIGTGTSPMIDEVLARAGSAQLKERKAAAGGLITEVFVMDAKGLNVAQSDVTSDFWQGDEAKFTETFGKPAETVHLSDIELDESTQTYQSQVSLPIVDPDTNAPIGAVTFGINLEMLN
ncbi:MAG: PDC sensor domain-containing protein [Pseudomonadota bacterium]